MHCSRTQSPLNKNKMLRELLCFSCFVLFFYFLTSYIKGEARDNTQLLHVEFSTEKWWGIYRIYLGKSCSEVFLFLHLQKTLLLAANFEMQYKLWTSQHLWKISTSFVRMVCLFGQCYLLRRNVLGWKSLAAVLTYHFLLDLILCLASSI